MVDPPAEMLRDRRGPGVVARLAQLVTQPDDRGLELVRQPFGSTVAMSSRAFEDPEDYTPRCRIYWTDKGPRSGTGARMDRDRASLKLVSLSPRSKVNP